MWHGGEIWTVSHQGSCAESISHITLRCYIHWVEHCYPYNTGLGSALAQYSNFLHQDPAEPASCIKVCRLHQLGLSVPFIMEKLLVETPTDIELCSSREGAILPSLCASSIPLLPEVTLVLFFQFQVALSC